MENNFVMKTNELSLWISTAMIALLAYLLDIRYAVVLIFWIVVIIFVGNAKRFYSDSHYVVSTIIRRSMYVVPFLLPLLTDFTIDFRCEYLVLWCFLGIMVGILMILPKKSHWEIILSKEIIETMAKRPKSDYYTQMYMLIGAAIGEEIFFRNFVIGYIDNVPYVVAIFLSCGLFFLNHFGVKWNTSFTMYDYIIQIVFAIISSIIFITSKSVLPSIAVHITYNFPSMLLVIKSYIYHYSSQ